MNKLGSPIMVYEISKKNNELIKNKLAQAGCKDMEVITFLELRLESMATEVSKTKVSLSGDAKLNRMVKYEKTPKWVTSEAMVVKSYFEMAAHVKDNINPADWGDMIIKSITSTSSKALLKEEVERWSLHEATDWNHVFKRAFTAVCKPIKFKIERQFLDVKPETNETIESYHKRFKKFVQVLITPLEDDKVSDIFLNSLPDKFKSRFTVGTKWENVMKTRRQQVFHQETNVMLKK